MFRFRRKSAEQIRMETLAEIGRRIEGFAVRRFDEHGPHDARGAALWDVASYIVEELGDGDWRCTGDGGRNEFTIGSTGNSTGPHLHLGPVS
jgi:hypothetical protein